MSRDLADETYYVSHGGMIPVKWTAPEAIHYKKYSTASDVWSYGCLLYEIWSLGHTPFESMEVFEVYIYFGIYNTCFNQYTYLKSLQVVRNIENGFRLAPPPGCPRLMYELMIRCWYVLGNCMVQQPSSMK